VQRHHRQRSWSPGRSNAFPIPAARLRRPGRRSPHSGDVKVRNGARESQPVGKIFGVLIEEVTFATNYIVAGGGQPGSNPRSPVARGCVTDDESGPLWQDGTIETEAQPKGDRGFESVSLQRRVRSEPRSTGQACTRSERNSPRKSGSHVTPRWREPDSNCRSRSCERLGRTADQDVRTATEGTEG
jgi:hypothetical protein